VCPYAAPAGQAGSIEVRPGPHTSGPARPRYVGPAVGPVMGVSARGTHVGESRSESSATQVVAEAPWVSTLNGVIQTVTCHTANRVSEWYLLGEFGR
jgi:hypothetical protein